METTFVHLHLHTEYSIIDGLITLQPLMDALPAKGMNAVAVTDFCNLFAVVKFYRTSLASGIKPILGCELMCYPTSAPQQSSTLVFLCQNETGYRNLTQLVSRAYIEGQYQGQPQVAQDWVFAHSEGLLVLSGGGAGAIGKALLAEDEVLATQLAETWGEVFKDRFYLEIQRTGRVSESIYNERVVRLSDRLNLPLVATNDLRFLEQDDFEAHEARVCIHEGLTLSDPRRKSRYTREQYLRSADEMVSLFSDLPQAIQNTVEICKRCNVKLEFGHNYLPKFPTPEGTTVEKMLIDLATIGLEERLKHIVPANRDSYDKRLQLELSVINSMGFASYFLIVADFIAWAKQNDIPVGPGRGSGVGSLVAYSLNITDLDPLQYELLFERFLNPERVSMPDFDIDFCMEGRDRIIEYVAEKYGRECVSQIITFGTMAAKAVVRDVGRVLGHPYGFVDKLAKLIPFELGITLKKALAEESELKIRYQNEDEVKELFDLAQKLEGTIRNAGKHAGGVVIAPSPLTDFTAIYCEEGSPQRLSQFDKDDVEATGLVKFDFLGLRTLTIIHWALQTINQTRKEDLINISTIPTDDKPTFDLLKKCQTTAVFQLESRGMKDLIHRLKPDNFEEVIALVALFRPGPLQSGMVDDFIDRKHGRSKVNYPHPDLESILKPTYGVILYQEQVMQIAQILANYTLGAADLLRRAMGKKKPEEMAKQREIFIQGALSRGVSANVASSTFDAMEKFAGYGFNKSHAAAYALVAYQTAWLKAHHPAAFMAAVLSADLDNTDKVVTFILECKRMNISVLPPDINQSQFAFTVLDERTILYGLGAIKGVGEAAIQCLVDARKREGCFEGLFQLCQRLDLRKVNRRVLEALIKSGAMDGWQVERSQLFCSIDKAVHSGLQFHQNQSSGQRDLFSLLEDLAIAETYIPAIPWPIEKRLEGEKETLGFYLTGHPATPYLNELKGFVQPIEHLNSKMSRVVMICGLITAIRRIQTRIGKRLAIINIEDPSGRLDIVAFSEVFEPYAALLTPGQMVVAQGELGQDDYTGGLKMTAKALYPMVEARTRFAKSLTITLLEGEQSLIQPLKAALKAHPGGCVVQIKYVNAKAKATVTLGKEWCVAPSDALLERLAVILEGERVGLCYV